MNCPACDRALAEMAVSDLTVDVCRGGCGGIWFDNFELKKVDEAHEGLGESLLEIERDPAAVVDRQRRRRCPRCEGQVMMRHFTSVRRRVEVDECPACAGIWLDAGELASIRTQFATEEERRRAAEEYFDEVFGPELERRQAKRSEKLERVERMASAFRFICPSYYLPGKQRWGAF